MNEYQKKLLDDLDTLFPNLLRLTDGKPYLISVKGSSLNFAGDEEAWYSVCSCCRKFVDNTWDHDNWCTLYEPEVLTKWLDSGTKTD